MNLTEEDIKTIKYQKRVGFVFPGALLVFTGLFDLIYPFYTRPNTDWMLLVVVDMGAIVLSVLLSYLMNRNCNLDLEDGTRKVKIEKVEDKEEEKLYEAGSGALYIPILGDLFPKLWKREMKPINKYMLIINGFRYQIDKDLYGKIIRGDLVEMYYSQYSEILLGIALKK